MKYPNAAILYILCIPVFAADTERTDTPSDIQAVEATVHALYKSIKFYDYDAMRALVTPEFELTYQGLRVNQPDFEAILRAGEVKYESGKPLPLHSQYELVDFEIEIAGDLAFSRSTYIDQDPDTDDMYDLIVLRRDNDNDERWLVHIFFHMPKAKENAAMQ